MRTLAVHRGGHLVGSPCVDTQVPCKTAVGGVEAGRVFEGDRRFPLIVRLPEELRANTEEIQRLPINVPEHGDDPVAGASKERFISLGSVAKIQVAPGPNQISRENGKRRIVVSANVRGRDVGSFVADVANLSRIVTLHNLNIAPPAKDSSGTLVMEATARTYRYLDAAEVAEVKRAAAEARAKGKKKGKK